MQYVYGFGEIGKGDVDKVGGKNASLGEMFQRMQKEGVRVPEGFATSADAYREFLAHNELEGKIRDLLGSGASLVSVGKRIRQLILKGKFSPSLEKAIQEAYEALGRQICCLDLDVAVRSSATAEDLADASFAGQQETFLHVRGLSDLLESCKRCFASLFTDRAITYRQAKGFDHLQVALSVGVQRMVRSDTGASGVMFTLDTESGFRDVVLINAAWGLGENVVQGSINPDQYLIFKPLMSLIEKKVGRKEKKMVYARRGIKNLKTTLAEQERFALSDADILQLAKWGCLIEKHYEKPMDIEWAKDGGTQELFIVQARPETVESQKKNVIFKTYRMHQKGKVLCSGLAIGESIAVGKAQVIRNVREISKFEPGSILITEMTSPDWVPIMQKASGIITDHGGRTSHAAIVSRELGIPAIVGTSNATRLVPDGKEVTLCCAEGETGFVYEGKASYEEEEVQLDQLPKIKTALMLNIASPEAALRYWRLPCSGIGLARMEFIINNIIQIHPMALVHFETIKDKKVRAQIEKLTRGYSDKKEYFVDHLAQGIAKIAASRYPDPVIVRMSDFKTNEYANLIGGEAFEPKEENPMLGFRGASRYYSPRYKEGFALECTAIKRVRGEMGFKNVIIMIPFCRTLEEADKVFAVLAENGLKQHQDGLQVYVMCEIPSNVILAEEFADKFDGFSIGSNDLTQLVLGVDRDAADLADLFDERNPAVKKMLEEVIRVARKKKCKIGICGQAPSDHPEFAAFLVQCGIDSISLNPDSIAGTLVRLHAIERP